VLWLGGTAAGIVGLAIYCAGSGSDRYAETSDTYPGLSVSCAPTVGHFLGAGEDALQPTLGQRGADRDGHTGARAATTTTG
jgi:hypothetical protein